MSRKELSYLNTLLPRCYFDQYLKRISNSIWKYFVQISKSFETKTMSFISYVQLRYPLCFLCPYCNNQQRKNHAHLVIFDQLSPKFGLIWLKRFVTCKYHSCNLDHKDHLLKFLKLSSVKNAIFLNTFPARYHTISGRIPNLA